MKILLNTVLSATILSNSFVFGSGNMLPEQVDNHLSSGAITGRFDTLGEFVRTIQSLRDQGNENVAINVCLATAQQMDIVLFQLNAAFWLKEMGCTSEALRIVQAIMNNPNASEKDRWAAQNIVE
jgi:hypothetical protein